MDGEQVGTSSIGATYTHTDEQLASTGSPIGVLPSTDLVNLNLNWEAIAGTPRMYGARVRHSFGL